MPQKNNIPHFLNRPYINSYIYPRTYLVGQVCYKNTYFFLSKLPFLYLKQEMKVQIAFKRILESIILINANWWV